MASRPSRHTEDLPYAPLSAAQVQFVINYPDANPHQFLILRRAAARKRRSTMEQEIMRLVGDPRRPA